MKNYKLGIKNYKGKYCIHFLISHSLFFIFNFNTTLPYVAFS